MDDKVDPLSDLDGLERDLRSGIRFSPFAMGQVADTIAALRAELDAARGRVRPLVWGDRPDGLDYRIGRCGQISYCVRCENGQWGYSRHGDVGLTVSYKGLPLFTDEQDAINGAEVDHRARILAALDPDRAALQEE